MEVLIRFKVKDEEEFDGMLEGSILDDETWELYDDVDCLIKRVSYSQSKANSQKETNE